MAVKNWARHGRAPVVNSSRILLSTTPRAQKAHIASLAGLVAFRLAVDLPAPGLRWRRLLSDYQLAY
jgi:hypothetical protein